MNALKPYNEKARTTLEAIEALRASLPPYPVKPGLGMVFDEQIKLVSWRFDTRKFRTIEVLHMTDLQFGHVMCNLKQLRKYREWVLDEDNRFVLFGGDMIDASTVLSPGEPWENVCAPQRQVYKFCEFFAPMRGRIIGVVGGNHERRGIRTFGDIGIAIATILQVPYSAGQQFINIEFGRHRPFKIFLWHGRGSARTPGAKMMMLYYAMRELGGGAHVTLVGHLHDAMMKWATHRYYNPATNRMEDRKITGAMSSSFLEYFGTYAEVAGMSPSDIIMARATIEPDGRWMLTVR